ncbi:MAG TPA: uroporphyrinogen decarboxylase [Elusimicrobiota bacterium]|nr:uroporphyrinogen decarboxylase [Elusimicrobiota bacterium]
MVKAPTGTNPLLENSLLLRACRGLSTERPPVWLMRQAGRYQSTYRAIRSRVSMLELCKNPDLVARVTVDAVQQLGVDAAILFSDLLLPVEPMGLSLEYAEGDGPRLAPPLRSPAQVDRLRPVNVEASLGFVAESVRRTRAALPADIPLLGFAGAPFTLASYMIEGGGTRNYVHTKTFMNTRPRAWHRLMEKIAAVVTDLLYAQIDAGVQGVQLFDSWVGVLSPSDYKTFVLPHSRSVFRGVRRGVPTIHFGTQTGTLLELLKEAGGSVIGIDWRVTFREARRRLGDVPLMGNLDPALLFSPPAAIDREVRRWLSDAGRRPGFIANLGHGILPGTPFRNVVHLVKTVKRLGRRRP